MPHTIVVDTGLPSAARLSRSAATGARWGMVSNLIQQLGRLGFTLVLARLVGPADFGVVAQAVIYIGFVQLFLDQGFGAALVQKKEVDRLDTGSVMWLNVVSAVLLAGLTYVLAPSVAAFFGTPELTDVLRVLSVALVVAGFSAVPLAMMNRALRFKAMAAVDVVAVLCGGAAGAAHAVAGGGYWALVTQNIVIATVTMTGLLIMYGRPPLRLSIARLRVMIGFSAGLFGTRVLSYAGSNGDNLLVGRFLGATDLAFYSLAFRMQRLPTQTLGRLVNQIAFPVYSRLQHDRGRIRSWFLLATRTTAVIAYPLLTTAILVIPFVVPLVLGEAWTPAILPMQLFTACAYRSITLKQAGPVFMAFGRTSVTFKIALVETAAILLACSIGLRWGVVGVAVGYLSSRLVVGPVVLAAAGKLLEMRSWTYAGAVLPVWGACGVLACTWLLTHLGLGSVDVGAAVSVPVATAAGLAAYLCAVRYLFRSTWDDASKVLGMVAGRRRSGAGSSSAAVTGV